jgi:hypothetical protein
MYRDSKGLFINFIEIERFYLDSKSYTIIFHDKPISSTLIIPNDVVYFLAYNIWCEYSDKETREVAKCKKKKGKKEIIVKKVK